MATGRGDDRNALVQRIPSALIENDLIAERVASWHADQADFQAALEIIERTWFFPWEVYKGVRFLYVDCWIGKGIQLHRARDYQAAIAGYRRAMEYPRNVGVGESRWKANAEALYRIGLALEESGERGAAYASWEGAAEEARPVPDALSYYRAMAMRKLGRKEEAGAALDGLLDHARDASRERAGAPAECRYLEGLALKGKGMSPEAQRSFRAALTLDPGHRRSRWEVSGFAGT